LGYTVSLACYGTCATTDGLTRKLVNVFSYEHTGGGLVAGWPGDLTTAFEATVWGKVTALLSTQYHGTHYEGYDNPLLAPPPLFSIPTSLVGGTGGARLPLCDCVNVHVLSGLRGRNWRGTKRYGPVPESQQVDDELTAVGLAAWEQAAASFLVELVTTPGDRWRPVVLSRVLSVVGPPAVYRGAHLNAVRVTPALGLDHHRMERHRHIIPTE
jgi:hypothetical protein